MKVKRIRGNVMTYDSFFKVLTDKRLEILRMIKKKHPFSVYELAKILKMRDLEHLKQIGLVEIKRTQEKKERTIPEVDYNRIDLEIVV